MLKQQGDPDSFKRNWADRKETRYNHWTADGVKNQIQLAFRCHFEVFQEILKQSPTGGVKGLETGCGRGTMSMYFAKSGFDMTLLDFDKNILTTAKSLFVEQNLKADFVQGDALDLPFKENFFDIVTNIGLLEHFEDIETVLKEQLRVLRPGGWALSYVVPERPDNIQRYFNWLNATLRLVFCLTGKKDKDGSFKPEVYRSNNYSSRYTKFLEKNKEVSNVTSFGMYPLPMISYSPEFPFTLMPPRVEVVIVKIFEFFLSVRRWITKRHGWICSEQNGQAFLVAYQKSQ